jgi:hypothetical protein
MKGPNQGNFRGKMVVSENGFEIDWNILPVPGMADGMLCSKPQVLVHKVS